MTYGLQRKAAIADAAWSEIPGMLDYTPAVNGVAQIIDPGAVALGKGFYCLILGAVMA